MVIFVRALSFLTSYSCFVARMESITHVPHLFSMKHIFLEENTAALSIQKKEEKIEFEQSSWRHKIQLIKVMCLIDNSKY